MWGKVRFVPRGTLPFSARVFRPAFRSVPRGTICGCAEGFSWSRQASSIQASEMIVRWPSACPSTRTRVSLPGKGIGLSQDNSPQDNDCRCANSSSVVMRASQPPFPTSSDAVCTACGIRSTARSVMQSNRRVSDSARPEWTVAAMPRVRTASWRKAAFLPCDSARVTAISGRQRAMGIPGNPAPEPKSSNVAIPPGRARAQAMDSTK